VGTGFPKRSCSSDGNDPERTSTAFKDISLNQRERQLHWRSLILEVDMRSREVGLWSFALAVLIAAASGNAAIAQTNATLKRLGILAPVSCPALEQPTRATVYLLRALAERGWIEGKTLVIDCVAPGDRSEQVPALAAELVARKPDVLFGASTEAIRALQQATAKISIVTTAPDPLRSGIVTNLARPDANVTGLAPMSFEIVSKRTELLRDLLPRFSRLAVISSVGVDSMDREHMQADITTAGHALGFTWEMFLPRVMADIDETLERIKADGFDAAYIWPSPFTFAYRGWIAAAALKYGVPTVSEASDDARSGVLVSYGIDNMRVQQTAAEYIDKLLRGAKPADLPLQQPTKLEMVINLKVAKALGLTIPEPILLRADEVIE
jgi:putative ABC transport system substrate-binding protein